MKIPNDDPNTWSGIQKCSFRLHRQLLTDTDQDATRDLVLRMQKGTPDGEALLRATGVTVGTFIGGIIATVHDVTLTQLKSLLSLDCIKSVDVGRSLYPDANKP